jgi:hypothetical protein
MREAAAVPAGIDQEHAQAGGREAARDAVLHDPAQGVGGGAPAADAALAEVGDAEIEGVEGQPAGAAAALQFQLVAARLLQGGGGQDAIVPARRFLPLQLAIVTVAVAPQHVTQVFRCRTQHFTVSSHTFPVAPASRRCRPSARSCGYESRLILRRYYYLKLRAAKRSWNDEALAQEGILPGGSAGSHEAGWRGLSPVEWRE